MEKELRKRDIPDQGSNERDSEIIPIDYSVMQDLKSPQVSKEVDHVQKPALGNKEYTEIARDLKG